MSALGIALTTGGIALTLSLLLPFIIRPLLVRLGIMDVPNERSSHERPVLRGLGLSVLIAIAVGGVVGYALLRNSGPEALSGAHFLLVVLGAAVLSALLGLREDFRGLSVPLRSTVQLLIALGSALALFAPRWLDGAEPASYGFVGGTIMLPEVEPLPIWLTFVLVPYAVLFISSYINVANFMDGLNGISGFHGVIAGAAFALAGLLSGQSWLLIAGVLLATGFAGFLPWNLTKPGAFLGDVGSYLLGGAVAVTSFAALASGVPILATIGPMIIYFGDVGVTLVRRVRRGEKWYEPHKEHVYQQLQQLGMSHVQASGVAAAFTLVASLLGLASFFVAPIWWLALLVAGLALLALYLALPRLLRRGSDRSPVADV